MLSKYQVQVLKRDLAIAIKEMHYATAQDAYPSCYQATKRTMEPN